MIAILVCRNCLSVNYAPLGSASGTCSCGEPRRIVRLVDSAQIAEDASSTPEARSRAREASVHSGLS